MKTLKCKRCGTTRKIRPDSWWAKNGLPTECAACGAPYAEQPKQQTQPEPESVFGIGGIGIYSENEAMPIPSETAMRRFDELMAHARYCKRCGRNDVIDGAMFTTNARPGYCDDCGG